MTPDIEALAKELFHIWKGPIDIGDTYPHVRIFWINLARDVTKKILEARIEELHSISSLYEIDERIQELTKQIKELSDE